MMCMSAQPPAWDDLEIFLAAVRGGGLSAAARALGINHGTVSRRVARLESRLGLSLFERSHRGVHLSPAGAELLVHVEAMEAEVQSISRKVVGHDQALAGSVRVSTVDDMAIGVLPAIVAEFQRRHPAVTLEIEVDSAHADLAKMQADIALRFGNPKAERGSVRRRLVNIASRLYASKGYLERFGTPTTPAELREHGLVRGHLGMASASIERFADRWGSPDRTALRSNLMTVRREAVRAGVGLGILPYFVGATDPELIEVEMEIDGLDAGLWLVMNKEVRRNARVRAFADHVAERLLAQRRRFDPAA